MFSPIHSPTNTNYVIKSTGGLFGSFCAVIMHFQRFVAWENLPSLTPKSDGFESSSSSKSGSVNEFASEGLAVPKITTTKKETMPVEIPIPVRRVLDKIDVEQLERAKKVGTKNVAPCPGKGQLSLHNSSQ